MMTLPVDPFNHPDYRVLRRIPPLHTWTFPAISDGADIRRGIILDTEATNKDPKLAKAIELAIVAFNYDAKTDTIVDIGLPKSWLQDPGEPLNEEIIRVTGLTDEVLAGQQFNRDEINAAIGDNLSLVITHNAEYDRIVCEKLFPWAIESAWACSFQEIDWNEIAPPARKLQVIAWHFGFFFDPHRAVADCLALAWLLTQNAPDGRPLSAQLISSARRNTYRIFAKGSPYETKDRLKSRGYFWNSARKVWWKDVTAAEVDEEDAWLKAHAHCHSPDVEKFNAYTRYRAEAA